MRNNFLSLLLLFVFSSSSWSVEEDGLSKNDARSLTTRSIKSDMLKTECVGKNTTDEVMVSYLDNSDSNIWNKDYFVGGADGVSDSGDVDFTNNWYVSYGNDGDNGSYGIGLRAGSIGIELFGVDDDEWDRDRLDYPVPHNDYLLLTSKDGSGYKRRGTTGVDMKGYFDISGELSMSVGAGYYWWDAEKIAMSNVTGWYYLQETKSDDDIGGSIGVQYSDNNVTVGVEYHTVRDVVINIGSMF